MKTKNIFLIIVLAISSFITSSCDDFLDKEPSKSTNKEIKDIEQLDALLGNYTLYYAENNHTALSSDDFTITPEINDARKSSTTIPDLEHILWNDEVTQTSRFLWDSEYAKIYNANLVLSNINNVSGDEETKANLKAEAHFVRAYSYFQLATAYTLYHTGSNGDELGLPLKQSISFEDPVNRASLEETWKFIDQDIQEALKIKVPYITNNKRRPWRGTTAAVNGFAARYYLYLGDYENAIASVDKVLAEYQILKDYNKSMYYSNNDDQYTINTSTNPEVVVVKYPYTKIQFYSTSGFGELFEWEELLYARTCSYAAWWYIPSQDLLNTYSINVPENNPMNDLRYKYFICEDFSLRYCSVDPAFRYPGFCQFYYDNIISGPTIGEMLLIKAEVQARKGDWQEAMRTIIPLRKARIDSSVYKELIATSKEDAITKILQERRREMPFTIRWYDMKRLNNNEDSFDNITVTREFYQYTKAAVLNNDPAIIYTLTPDSRHYASPIPNVELDRTKGQLEQNKY